MSGALLSEAPCAPGRVSSVEVSLPVLKYKYNKMLIDVVQDWWLTIVLRYFHSQSQSTFTGHHDPQHSGTSVYSTNTSTRLSQNHFSTNNSETANTSPCHVPSPGELHPASEGAERGAATPRIAALRRRIRRETDHRAGLQPRRNGQVSSLVWRREGFWRVTGYYAIWLGKTIAVMFQQQNSWDLPILLFCAVSMRSYRYFLFTCLTYESYLRL